MYKTTLPRRRTLNKTQETKITLEINDGFSNGEIPLYSPWQVKEFSHDELEDLVHIYVMS